MSSRSIDVVNHIQAAQLIAEHHPALAARMSRAGASVDELRAAYSAYLFGVPTRWWFTGERFYNRKRLRAAGKRQRQARKRNRGC